MILVVSDIHHNTFNLSNLLSMRNDFEHIIFLGDGERNFLHVIDQHSTDSKPINYSAVSGNCDFCSSFPDEDLIIIKNKRIFITHGHKYSVKAGYSKLIETAQSKKADILLFGHTHDTYTNYIDGLYIMNPGSLGSSYPATFATLDITPAGIVLHTAVFNPY